jgi:hypothetical protein
LAVTSQERTNSTRCSWGVYEKDELVFVAKVKNGKKDALGVGSTFRVLSFYGLGMNRRPSFRKASYTEQIAQLAAACDWLKIDRNRGEIPPAFRKGFGRVSLARAA